VVGGAAQGVEAPQADRDHVAEASGIRPAGEEEAPRIEERSGRVTDGAVEVEEDREREVPVRGVVTASDGTKAEVVEENADRGEVAQLEKSRLPGEVHRLTKRPRGRRLMSKLRKLRKGEKAREAHRWWKQRPQQKKLAVAQPAPAHAQKTRQAAVRKRSRMPKRQYLRKPQAPVTAAVEIVQRPSKLRSRHSRQRQRSRYQLRHR